VFRKQTGKTGMFKKIKLLFTKGIKELKIEND